jgi:two-component system cell cycle sensor histidine kinase/response regulator CckA
VSRLGNKKRETILVVEDSEILRTFIVAILERADFNVIWADSGPHAIDLAATTEGKIDLLLSAWDMPEMSGIQLGQALIVARPDLHIMQMSGGAHDALMVLNYGWAYLQKPFVAKKLVEMINNVLHSPNRSQPGGESFDTRLDTKPNSLPAEDPQNHPADSDEPKDRRR